MRRVGRGGCGCAAKVGVRQRCRKLRICRALHRHLRRLKEQSHVRGRIVGWPMCGGVPACHLAHAHWRQLVRQLPVRSVRPARKLTTCRRRRHDFWTKPDESPSVRLVPIEALHCKHHPCTQIHASISRLRMSMPKCDMPMSAVSTRCPLPFHHCKGAFQLQAKRL